jgi:enoyl-CoA hydratase/carnithine racemase
MTVDAPTADRRETVVTRREGYVARITLDRPDAMNTFSTRLAEDLDEALRESAAADGTRAIVIDGAGDVFSAGIDLGEHADHDTADEYQEWVAAMEQPFVTVADIETPVIAAAHGHAAANGLGLVAACDLAVATEGTRFGATAPKVGLFCMGPSVPLMQTLSRKRTLELILTGELIDAETAEDWGLVNRVVPTDGHVDAAMDLAETIAAKSPTAIGMGKQAYYEMEGMDYEAAIDYSNERFATLCTTADAREGIGAFLAGDTLSDDEWPAG